MIIWKGWGILVFVIAVASLVIAHGIAEAATGNPQYYATHDWVKCVAFLAAAAPVYFIGRHINNKPGRILAKVEWHSGELFPRIGFMVTNLKRPAKAVVRFYNQRGTAEQWIKEGKNAVKWTRLSCHDFVDNQVRLQLFVLAYNLGNFLRQAVLPRSVQHWTLTTLREKLIKIGAKVVRHSKKVVFQMAEVAVPRELFWSILQAIGRLRLSVTASG